jgi:hypothetical protein
MRMAAIRIDAYQVVLFDFEPALDRIHEEWQLAAKAARDWSQVEFRRDGISC